MVSTTSLVDAVARVSCVPAGDLLGKSRFKVVVRQRQALMFVMYRKQRLARQQICHGLNMERTAVEYGIRRFEELLRERDPDAVRNYRTAIRCYVRLKQQQKRYNEGVRNALENHSRVQRSLAR